MSSPSSSTTLSAPPSRPSPSARSRWWSVVAEARSRILALVAVFLAAFRDYTPYLGAGEVATIAVIAANRLQARTIFRYTLGLLEAVPALKAHDQRRHGRPDHADQPRLHRNPHRQLQSHPRLHAGGGPVRMKPRSGATRPARIQTGDLPRPATWPGVDPRRDPAEREQPVPQDRRPIQRVRPPLRQGRCACAGVAWHHAGDERVARSRGRRGSVRGRSAIRGSRVRCRVPRRHRRLSSAARSSKPAPCVVASSCCTPLA